MTFLFNNNNQSSILTDLLNFQPCKDAIIMTNKPGVNINMKDSNKSYKLKQIAEIKK